MKQRIQGGIKEQKRLLNLRSYDIGPTTRDKFLDNITSIASKICETPVAVISLAEEHKQLIISRKGNKLKENPGEATVCNHVSRHHALLEVPDTLQSEFFQLNPLVNPSHGIRYYAGIPLIDHNGHSLGALCVIGNEPKSLNTFQKSTIKLLAKSAIDYISLRKNKNELDNATGQLQHFFLLSPDFLCTAAPNGFFLNVSAAFTRELGFSETELLSVPFIEFVHPDDQNATLQILQGINLNSDKVMFFRNRYRCKNGNYVWLSWNAIPDKKSGVIFATARNITKVIELEDQLVEKNKLEIRLHEEKLMQLSNLTSSISRELQNPVNLAIGFTDISLDLLTDMLNPSSQEITVSKLEQIRSDLLKTREHCKRISSIIQKMNEITWNQMPPAIQEYNPEKEQPVNRLCAESRLLAYNQFKTRYPEFECEFEFQFDDREPRCQVSVTDFSKALISLFYNAFEAIQKRKTAENGFYPKVTLKTRLTGTHVEIDIGNNGIALPSRNRSLVFNPFYTTKQSGEGLGLGLTVCYNILKLYNGSVAIIKSDDLETLFRITLPAIAVRPAEFNQ